MDPLTARDLDDAVSIREWKDSRRDDKLFLVGVHIADVSHYIEVGSEVDKEARRRTTSVYLPHRVIPMLPRLLCEKLCSLNPDEDKFAFTV